MDDTAFRVRFWGVRGSLPVSGPDFQRYGGNTICIGMECGPHRLIFDAGSGIMPAGLALKGEGISAFHILFTHCHYDHIVGLPFFPPLYDPRCKVALWSGHMAGRMTTRQMIGEFMRPPWFPIEPDICRASLNAKDFKAGDVLRPESDLLIRTGKLNHPGDAIGYRVEFAGRVCALITDTEHTPGTLDTAVLSLIKDADLMIYDCTYTDDEMPRFLGYGHSSWQQAIRLARTAGVKKVAFIHHSPLRTDDELDAIAAAAAEIHAGAFPAYDGQIITL